LNRFMRLRVNAVHERALRVFELSTRWSTVRLCYAQLRIRGRPERYERARVFQLADGGQRAPMLRRGLSFFVEITAAAPTLNL
jgi:hypothetical protein